MTNWLFKCAIDLFLCGCVIFLIDRHLPDVRAQIKYPLEWFQPKPPRKGFDIFPTEVPTQD